MPILTVITRAGERRTVTANLGQTLKQALMDAGVAEINSVSTCGGCCSCGTCHVYIDAEHLARLPPMQVQENDLLGALDDRRENSRLSCQVESSAALDGASVAVAPEW